MTAGSGGLPALAFLASSFQGGTDVAAPLRQALAFLDTEACYTQAPAPPSSIPGSASSHGVWKAVPNPPPLDKLQESTKFSFFVLSLIGIFKVSIK